MEGVSGTDGGVEGIGGVGGSVGRGWFGLGVLEVALEGGAGVGGDWYGALEVLLEGGGRAVEGGLGEPGGGLAVGSVMTGGPFLRLIIRSNFRCNFFDVSIFEACLIFVR